MITVSCVILSHIGCYRTVHLYITVKEKKTGLDLMMMHLLFHTLMILEIEDIVCLSLPALMNLKKMQKHSHPY